MRSSSGWALCQRDQCPCEWARRRQAHCVTVKLAVYQPRSKARTDPPPRPQQEQPAATLTLDFLPPDRRHCAVVPEALTQAWVRAAEHTRMPLKHPASARPVFRTLSNWDMGASVRYEAACEDRWPWGGVVVFTAAWDSSCLQSCSPDLS